jgi:hypothetical protein
MQNEEEIMRPVKRRKIVQEFANEKAEKVTENLSDQGPSETIMHLDTCVDVGPFFQVEEENEDLPDLVGSYHVNFAERNADRVFLSAEGDFFQIFGGHPSKKRGDFKKLDNFHVGRLCLFHDVVKVMLEAINTYKSGGLNIITGEDLLRSVGRLSMMITSADYLCEDEDVIPLNLTSGKYLTSRLQGAYRYKGGREDLEKKVKRITDNIEKAAPGLWKVSAYEDPSTLKGRVELSQALISKFPFLINVLSHLDVESIKSLAQVNRTFLVLVGFAPPSWLFNDPGRKQLIARLAVATALLIRNGNPPFLSDLSDTPNALGLLSFEGPQSLGEKDVKELEGLAYAMSYNYLHDKSDKYGMYLPWGGSQAVTLLSEDSVRLIFSQGLTILKKVTGGDTGKVDLTYEDIVKYLKSQPEDQIATKIKEAFLNLEGVNNSFIGELIILLVGIEGSQNNLAVLHAPMVIDLVCSKKITWNQAFFLGSNKVPYFAMAAHKGAKGEKPMTKHSEIIRRFNYQSEPNYEDGKFWDFLDGELDLHEKFLKTYWPQLDDYEEGDQLILSTLIIKYYLINTFFTDPWGKETLFIHQRVDELLKHNFYK